MSTRRQYCEVQLGLVAYPPQETSERGFGGVYVWASSESVARAEVMVAEEPSALVGCVLTRASMEWLEPDFAWIVSEYELPASFHPSPSILTCSILSPAPPSPPPADASNVTGQLFAFLHFPVVIFAEEGFAGFVYGLTEFSALALSLTPPSASKPLRASTVNR